MKRDELRIREVRVGPDELRRPTYLTYHLNEQISKHNTAIEVLLWYYY